MGQGSSMYLNYWWCRKKSEKEVFVIPAQAGIQFFHIVKIRWIPVFKGMTTFYQFIIIAIWW